MVIGMRVGRLRTSSGDCLGPLDAISAYDTASQNRQSLDWDGHLGTGKYQDLLFACRDQEGKAIWFEVRVSDRRGYSQFDGKVSSRDEMMVVVPG